jgi:protein-tyrosine kinase
VSKIFEALQKTESGAAEIALSLLGEDTFPAEPAAATPETVTLPQEAQRQEVPQYEAPQYETTQAQHVTEVPPTAPTPVSQMRVESVHLAEGSPLLPFDGSDPGAAEQYKMMRTKLRHHPDQPRMLLVSSPMPGDGKTISAANLASALALQADLRVLLVDSDFRRSTLTGVLGLPKTPGLSEVLRGEATLESALISVEQFPNLYFLPSGGPVRNPSELLTTAKWQELLATFRQEFRFTVFDAPPAGVVADYDLLQAGCDGVILVVRPDHTNRQQWRKALEIVPKAKQLGVILNCVEDWFLWKTNKYYQYYSDNVQ